MQGIAFKVTNLATGEAHVIVTDKNGSHRSGGILESPYRIGTIP